MSSIYGLLTFNQLKITESLANKIDQTTAWWSPDFSFSYRRDNLLLGQQVLISHKYAKLESKTIFNHESGIRIISDARIDNRQDLLSELRITENISNSELILHLYHKYEEACFSKLIGAFAIAIWNDKKQKLICARDQMGIKPLSYYFKDGIFAFGTQPKSITAITEIDKTPNWRYIFNAISMLAVEDHSSEYKHIQHCPPGTFLEVQNNRLSKTQYWELDIETEITYKNPDQYVEEFRHLLLEAIQCRMYQEGMTATHLSGGLDSSGITSVAHSLAQANHWEHTVLSYNVVKDFNGDEQKYDENLKAFDLIQFLNLESKFTNVNTPLHRTLLTEVKHEVLCCDGPSRSNNVNTEYEIQAEASKQGTKVLLSGFPGDELVTSFCRPFYLEHLDKGKLIKYFFDKKKSRHTFQHRLKAFLPALAVKTIPKITNTVSQKYAEQRYKDTKFKGESIFLNKDYFSSSAELKSTTQPKIYAFAHRDFPTSLKQYQRNHVCREHTYRRIGSEKLAGKHWHVDYRYPLADIRLLQFMISIPMEQKISKDMSRRLFRLGMKDYLPDSIRLRDIKRAGSLKPMSTIARMPNKKEVFDFIQTLKSSEKVPFLDLTVVDKWIRSKNNAYRLYPWLILAQLGLEDKLDFNNL
jgi:asparagine synthase (glutamine-hydrolysing)